MFNMETLVLSCQNELKLKSIVLNSKWFLASQHYNVQHENDNKE